jgi:DNA-binding IclR family transcriptional regulator
MVQSVERAILILRCFTKEKPELRLREISEALGLNKSTVHGLLNTLKNYDFLQQDAETQKYRLGMAVLDISSRLLDSIDIRSAASPVIKELCDQTGETVHLVVLQGTDVIYIDKRESNQSIRLFTSIGTRYPAYATGVGKAILAYKPHEELGKHLPHQLASLTANTITSHEIMASHLAEVRRCGYALDNEEILEGLSCVAAPIFDHDNVAIAAISIAGPTTRMNAERRPQLTAAVSSSARQISMRLGCSEPSLVNILSHATPLDNSRKLSLPGSRRPQPSDEITY